MYYIDTHTHVYSEFYDNIDEIVSNAKTNNVLKIINCADNIKSANEILKLQERYKGFVYVAIGIHPEHANEYSETQIQGLEKLIKNNKICDIGEIGLDYHYSIENKKKQKEMFEKQLSLAEKYNLPVIIHARESNKDCIEILSKYKLKGVFHSFHGTIEESQQIINMNFLIGINGMATFKNAEEIREVLKEIPITKIILETDCPFLTPEPFRKYKNEPKYIPNISTFVSDFYNISEEKLLYTTTKNALELFDLE